MSCRHLHGTRHRNARRSCHRPCNCPGCRAAHARYERTRTRANKAGVPFKVPVDRVAQHLSELEKQGLRRDRISILTGISHDTLNRIVKRRQKAVYGITADLIFGVDPDEAPLVDPTGSRRRLQALCRVGHTFKAIELAGKLTAGSVDKTLRAKRVTRATAERIKAVYDAMYAQDGPSTRTAGRAERAGWHGPWAWTDATIDDPNAVASNHKETRQRRLHIEPVRVDNAVAGQRTELTVAERRVVVQRLHAQGFNDRSIERHTGISERTALRIRQELRLPAIGGNQLAGVA